MKTTTVRLSDQILSRVDSMAGKLKRSRSWIINQAVDNYLSHEEWLIKEIHEGLSEAERNEFATENELKEMLAKWGVNAD